VKNMVSGAARAEAAFLVIDAGEGMQENSRRHAYLLHLLGVTQVCVIINKMDTAGYLQARFDRVKEEAGAFLREIGIEAAGFIPASGRHGDNIVTRGTGMPWYLGPTLLDMLDSFQKPRLAENAPFRMLIQDIYRFTQMGDTRRIVAGRVLAGAAQVGDELVFFPSGKTSHLGSVETYPPQAQPVIGRGRPAGITLVEQIYLRRGEIAARASEAAPQVAVRLRASLFWLGRAPMGPDKRYWLKLGTARVQAQLEAVERVIDSSNLRLQAEKREVACFDAAEVVLRLQQPLAFELPGGEPELGRFVIVDDYQIAGGGIIQAALPDRQSHLRDLALERNRNWVPGSLTSQDRAARYQQKPCLVIITGLKGIGRKNLARLVEDRLFSAGHLVYYVGFGSVVHGLSRDIAHTDAAGRSVASPEHLRRLAEVAHLMLDAGMIMALTAIELTASNLEMLSAALPGETIVTVWMGNEVTTDIPIDLRILEEEPPANAVERILALLHEQGLIIK
jgi:bifunctional enzyme CysN/CysC